MVMLAVSIYYFYIYFFGLEYSLTYYRDNWLTRLNDEEKKLIKEPKKFGFFIWSNPNNASLDFYLWNGKEEKSFDKCNENLELDENGDVYCFDLSFYHLSSEEYKVIYLSCEENCIYPNGDPAKIGLQIYSHNLKINHKKKNPLSIEGLYGDRFVVATNNKFFVNYLYQFTPIIYYSSGIFTTKSFEYVTTYFNDVHVRSTYSNSNNDFFALNLVMNTHCDIYTREYKTLLNTLATMNIK